MRTLALALLLANLALAAWQFGWLGPVPDNGREPGRAAQQIAADRVVLLTAEQAAALASRAPAERSGARGCVEFGGLGTDAATRLRARLAALGVGDRTSTRTAEGATLYAVFVPPLPDRAAAEAVAADLRRKGVTDLLVLGAETGQANAVSLGLFRDRELATRHLADLRRRGVANVQMEPRAGSGATVRLRVDRLSDDERDAVLLIEREAGLRAGACTP